MHTKPRWHYRFDNYKRAFHLLRSAIEQKSQQGLSDLELEGLIQRFEYTWELAWKTLKDYLENDAIRFDKITPKSVIVTAIEAKIISDREGWMQALDDRNQMSHVYSNTSFLKIATNIEQTYLSLFDQLYEKLLNDLMDDEN